MGRVVLDGGTDVAEMVLFDVDALPERPPDDETLAALEREHAAIRLQTGADGSYLLHAYVDIPVPDSVLRHCSTSDAITGDLRVAGGNLGFGGAEWTSSQFPPGSGMRSTRKIAPGNYDVTAYRTEYPSELLDSSIRGQIGKAGHRLLNLPQFLIPATLIGAFVAYFRFGPSTALWIAGLGIALMIAFLRSPYVKQLQAKSTAVQSEFPSIVVHMRRN